MLRLFGSRTNFVVFPHTTATDSVSQCTHEKNFSQGIFWRCMVELCCVLIGCSFYYYYWWCLLVVLSLLDIDIVNLLSVVHLFMSPLRRHIFVCFMAKSAFWIGFSALAPYTGVGPIKCLDEICSVHPPLHTLKIWGGGSTPRGARRPSLFVCLFFCRFFCPSRYDARHRKPRWCV